MRSGLASALIGAALLCGTAARDAQALVTFEPGDLGQFTLNGDHATNLTVTPGTGVGGGSGLISTASVSGFSTDSAVFNTGAAMATGQTYTVSIFYQMALQGSGPDLRLGFTTAPTGIFNRGTPPHTWYETYGMTTGKQSFSAGSAPTISGPDVSMTEGNWYRMTLSLTNVDSVNFNAVVTVDDFGAAGTALMSNQLTFAYAFVDAALGSASTLYGGFYAHGETTAFDNFDFGTLIAEIPEPSVLAIFLFGLAGLGMMRRVATATR